ncbi:MAG: hypothetical protein QM756_39185 [Polyangiaceae bacterium]
MRAIRACLLALVSAGGAGCAAERASLIQTTPEFKPGAQSVSIVGVFRKGRLDQTSWTAMAPHVVSAFGGEHCIAAYGHELRDADPDTYAAFDRRVKEEGLSAEALRTLMPYTEADLLVIFDARDPRARAPRIRKDPTDLPGRPLRSGIARSQTHPSEPPTTVTTIAGAGFSLTASLYSTSLRKSVARIDTNDADTLDGAASELAQNLKRVLNGSRCAPWKWTEHQAAPPAAPAAAAPSDAPAAEAAPSGAPPAGSAGAPAE